MDWAALRVSLWLGAGTIAILLPLGVWFGRLLAVREFNGKLLVEALVTVPLVLPPTVLGFYLLVTFGARSPLGQAFQAVVGLWKDRADIGNTDTYVRKLRRGSKRRERLEKLLH